MVKICCMKSAKNSEEVPRTIRLSKEVWEALDEDAGRCFRSPNKHLEALLTKWFQLGDIEIYFEQTKNIQKTKQKFK